MSLVSLKEVCNRLIASSKGRTEPAFENFVPI